MISVLFYVIILLGDNMEYIEIIFTYDKITEAKRINKYLLENRLICCAQTNKINSSYWWNNEIVDNEEYQVVMKTKKSLLNEIVKYIKDNHSYEVPEIIIRELKSSNEDYLKWIENETKKIGW